MSEAAYSYQHQVEVLVKGILQDVHPLMAEAFRLAALPLWCPVPLFAALRNRTDRREEGLIERLEAYPFVSQTVDPVNHTQPGIAVSARQRQVILEDWIAREPDSFRAAHTHSLTFWQANPDPNSFAQQQVLVYHRLFVDFEAGVGDLIAYFRVYVENRFFAAGDRLLSAAREAHALLALLPPSPGNGGDGSSSGLGQLLTALSIQLDQLRGRWDARGEELRGLRFAQDLPPGIFPFVARLRGYGLLHNEQYVDAINEFNGGLHRLEQAGKGSFAVADMAAERGALLTALGDAHVAFADSLRTPAQHLPDAPHWWQRLRGTILFLLSLPRVLYLSFALGQRVWRTALGESLYGMDWMVTRLYALGVRFYRQADQTLTGSEQRAERLSLSRKLAEVYLTLGDAEAAIETIDLLEAGAGAELGIYPRAVLRVARARAELLRKRPEQAVDEINRALPVLVHFEDFDLAVRTRSLLADAYWTLGQREESLQQFADSVAEYQRREEWEAATGLVERLASLRAQAETPANIQPRIDTIISSLPRRHYSVAYCHPLWRLSQILLFVLLAFLLFAVPLLVIQIDPVYELKPAIGFTIDVKYGGSGFALPRLDDVALRSAVHQMTVDVSSGRAWVWGGLIALGLYLLFSLLLGLLLIAVTPLWLIERYVSTFEIEIDDQELRFGSGSSQRVLPLAEIDGLVSANLGVLSLPIPNFSTFTLLTPHTPAMVDGNTNWYASLNAHLRTRMSSSVRLVNADYWLGRSTSLWLYLAGLLIFVLLAIAVRGRMDFLNLFIVGSAYRPIDLYPYLFLTLLPAPLYWFVLRPLRLARFQNPTSQRAWWVLALAGLLLVVQLLARFRPLITGVNLVLPVLTLALGLAAAFFLWQARESSVLLYPRVVRVGVALSVCAVVVLMLVVLGRESAAYHALATGNSLQERYQTQTQTTDPQGCPSPADDPTGGGLAAYDRAIAARPAGSFSYDWTLTRTVTTLAPDSLTPILAVENKAALLVRLGCYPQALALYKSLDGVSGRPDRLYAQIGALSQAVAAAQGVEQSAQPSDATTQPASGGELDAVGWYSRALADNPDRAELYLWRGLALQTAKRTPEAECDYRRALGLDVADLPACEEGTTAGKDTLTALSLEDEMLARTALGWIKFGEEQDDRALNFFQTAISATADSPQPWIGLGNVYYRMSKYEDAAQAGEKALALEPRNLAALILTSSAHWKLGGVTEDAELCKHYEAAFKYLNTASQVEGQTSAKIAFWYRTEGNLLWLLQSKRCTPDRVATLEESIASYDKAIDLVPDKADYFHMRARLRIALWEVNRNELRRKTPLADWLIPIKEDMESALSIDPTDRGEYKPNAFTRHFLSKFVFSDALIALPQDPERARTLYTLGAELGSRVEGGHRPVQQAAAALDAYIRDNPGVADPRLIVELDGILATAQGFFDKGLAALKAGEVEAARSNFGQGLDAAVEEANPTLAADNLLAAAVATNGVISDSVLASFAQRLPDFTAANDPKNANHAFKLGLMATILEQFDAAGYWFNEGIRRTEADSEQYRFLRAVPEDLRRLWQVRGSTTTPALIDAMQNQLPEQLREHPELEQKGYYWRYRGWFKFHLGRVAFLERDEAGARWALDVAIPDGDKAYELNATEGSSQIQTYLKEGGWGWYYVLRARESEKDGDDQAALSDYEAAVRYYKPVADNEALTEQRNAAFSAAEIAAKSNALDKAVVNYDIGSQLAISTTADAPPIWTALCGVENLARRHAELDLHTIHANLARALSLTYGLDQALYCNQQQIHIGNDEFSSASAWASLYGTCWATTFQVKKRPASLVLHMQIFGAEEKNWIELNDRQVAVVLPQALRSGENIPNYWSESISLPLVIEPLRVGTNHLKICAAFPADGSDQDEFQFRNLWLVAQ